MIENCRRCNGRTSEPDDAMAICTRCWGTGVEPRELDDPPPIREPEEERR